jgi:hypothetical protein
MMFISANGNYMQSILTAGRLVATIGDYRGVKNMTLDEQDKITEVTARLRASAVVFDECERDTKEHSGALWLVWDAIGVLEGFVQSWNEEKAPETAS